MKRKERSFLQIIFMGKKREHVDEYPQNTRGARTVFMLSIEVVIVLCAGAIITGQNMPFLAYSTLLGFPLTVSTLITPVGFLLVVLIFTIITLCHVTSFRCLSDSKILSSKTLRSVAIARIFLAFGAVTLAVLLRSPPPSLALSLSDTLFEMFTHSFSDETIQREVSLLQYTHQCCGLKKDKFVTKAGNTAVSLSNNTSPVDVWLAHFDIGNSYSEQMSHFYSTPWSCCSLGSLDCGHLGFERFVIDYTKEIYEEYGSKLEDMQWYSVPFADHRTLFNSLRNAVNEVDCVDKLLIDLQSRLYTVIAIALGVAAFTVLLNSAYLIWIDMSVKKRIDDNYTLGKWLRPPKAETVESREAKEKPDIEGDTKTTEKQTEKGNSKQSKKGDEKKEVAGDKGKPVDAEKEVVKPVASPAAVLGAPDGKIVPQSPILLPTTVTPADSPILLPSTVPQPVKDTVPAAAPKPAVVKTEKKDAMNKI